MEKCNGTGLVLRICEAKNNVWKKYELSIQNCIDNCTEIIKIKPDFASGNDIKSCLNPHKHWGFDSQIPDLIAK